MNPEIEHIKQITRRHFFRQGSLGLGVPALASLMGGINGPAFGQSATGGLPSVPHFAPKAKRAIWLFMAGAPAQMDMFDYKPKMDAMFDKDLPESVRMGQRLTTMTSGQKRFPLAPSIYKFKQQGKSGAWVSDLLPHLSKRVDDMAIVKSMYTEAINHDPAITFITTGRQLPGWASLGAWLSYGLGTTNEDLPAFVTMTSSWTGRKQAQALFNRLWGSGFLPSRYQGIALRSKGDPVLFLSDPPGVGKTNRRSMLDVLAKMNTRQHEVAGDPETQARIAQYEMAYRMQTSVPELTDLSKEPKSVLDMYGPEVKKPGTFAQHCLLARRMAQRGVRFSQIFHRGWDQHNNLPKDLPSQCRDFDQPAAALIEDLKQQGLLEDTLVIWGGEFGRTIYCQGKLTRTTYGRDHHPRCFTFWLAGGGIKGGVVHGETDDFSYNITENPVHIRDLNATILHLLGINHQKLTFDVQGVDLRLAGFDEEAHIVRDILA